LEAKTRSFEGQTKEDLTCADEKMIDEALLENCMPSNELRELSPYDKKSIHNKLELYKFALAESMTYLALISSSICSVPMNITTFVLYPDLM
jgi:hypothetical protein